MHLIPIPTHTLELIQVGWMDGRMKGNAKSPFVAMEDNNTFYCMEGIQCVKKVNGPEDAKYCSNHTGHAR